MKGFNMKSSDIKQFISCNNGYVGVRWRYLKDWIELNNVNLNPDFQRGNVWTYDQKQKYLEYILRGGISSKNIYVNCVGGLNETVIVDGKQRISAVIDLLDNNIKVFGYYLNEFEDNILAQLDIGFTVYTNNLININDLLNWYLELNTGGTVHTEEELNKVRLMLNGERIIEQLNISQPLQNALYTILQHSDPMFVYSLETIEFDHSISYDLLLVMNQTVKSRDLVKMIYRNFRNNGASIDLHAVGYEYFEDKKYDQYGSCLDFYKYGKIIYSKG